MSFLLIPISLYVFLILWISHHWFWGKVTLSDAIVPSTKVSVLIPFKNEIEHLPQLLQHLRKQSYSPALVEFIFINDHSADRGEALLSSESYTLINNLGVGKKAALQSGLKQAHGELIVTLDADCLPSEKWLEIIVRTYEAEHPSLIICPVVLAPLNTLWDKMQAIEFQSLAASTGGSALGGKPIMCNGANLAFAKNLVNTEVDVFNTSYASGDDMFLLEYAKRKNAKITYLKHPEAIVTTPPETWQKFWSQRLRWTSKSTGYTDIMIILVGAIVLLSNLSLFILPFFSLFGTLLALTLKAVVDVVLLLSSASFFKTSRHLWVYLLMLPLYPFYVLVSTVGGLFTKRW